MVVLGVDARLFFRAVADAEVHALMLAFGDRHLRWHLRRLLLCGFRLDVHELEELHPVKPPLTVQHEASLIQVAGPKRQLAPNDVVAHALVSGNPHGTEKRHLSRLRLKREPGFLSPRSIVLVGRHLRVRKSVIAELVECEFVGLYEQLTVARLAGLLWHTLSPF